ncbi:MAG: phosphate ABC transporter substrate-binding protein [Gammaproteobacteria bacterium]|nr:phosphate ABC transporter substrate-binding protein [Gammaproteobacteria bacterium]
MLSGLLLGFAAAAAAEVVVVVSSQNPVEALSRAQLADIYLGRLHRFPNGDPVIPIDQKERSPAHDEFYSEYLGQSPAQVKQHWSKLIFTGRGQPPRSVSDDLAAAETVAGNPNAIGYLDAGLVDDRLRIIAIE